MARTGSMVSLRKLTLTPCASERSTALRVTSAPVPAVVGTAMHGMEGFARERPCPITSK